jgi:DNA-binding MarR family transcriptional regulator
VEARIMDISQVLDKEMSRKDTTMTENTNENLNENSDCPDDNLDGPEDQTGGWEEPEDQADPRRIAAERLSYLAMLQFQHRRRGPRGGEPWRDPRHGQGRVLALLKIKPEMTQRELTYLMGMSRQSIAELLRKLENQGLVERQPSAEDRRTVIVSLTEAGKATDQGDDPDGPAIGRVLDCLSDEEVANLVDYLGRIIERLEEESGEDFEQRREMIERFWQGRGEDPRRRGGFPGFGPWGGWPDGGESQEHGPHGHGPHGHGPHGHGPRGPRWGEGPWDR